MAVLGGYAIEELARLGVGTIIAIDPDAEIETAPPGSRCRGTATRDKLEKLTER